MRKITLPNTETRKMHTKDKLGEALDAIGLTALAERARAGQFDDFISDSATPITDIVNELAKVGSVEALALRRRLMEGDFDGTPEESEEWMKSKEGQETMRRLIRGE